MPNDKREIFKVGRWNPEHETYREYSTRILAIFQRFIDTAGREAAGQEAAGQDIATQEMMQLFYDLAYEHGHPLYTPPSVLFTPPSK